MSALVTHLTLADAMAVASNEALPLTDRVAALRETQELAYLRSDFTDAVATRYDFDYGHASKDPDECGPDATCVGWGIAPPRFDDDEHEEALAFLEDIGADVPEEPAPPGEPDPEVDDMEAYEDALSDYEFALSDYEFAMDDWKQEVVDLANEAIDEDPSAWEPMMSYRYPAPRRLSCEDFNKTAGTLIAVYIDGEPAFALSGAGMDMSGAVARGYLSVGYLPPASCADGAVQSHCDPTPLVKAACLLSCLIEQQRAVYRTERLVERLRLTNAPR